MARYLITMAPVEDIVGKLTQAKTKCSPQTGTSRNGNQYYYGQNRFGSKNNFAMRLKCRDLKTNPFKQNELALQSKFRTASESARETMADPDLRLAAEAKFKKQDKYKTLRTYLIANYIKNN